MYRASMRSTQMIPQSSRPLGHSLRAYSSSTPNIPVIRTLGQLRRWRQEARERKLEVGVVPTMGALHDGHLNLVRTSLQRHPVTVMTLFVNPMQFAPHEDLSSYPRTLERDLDLLRTLLPLPSAPTPPHSQTAMRGLGVSENESFRPQLLDHDPQAALTSHDSPLVVFAPPTEVLYPLKGELQDLSKQRGVTVSLNGWGDVMEGSSRPQFFTGVATVCTKLFNAVEPDHAYFGQKDIQQALLLKIMLTDLLLSHPTSDNLHILPTTRDPISHLALSSRNAYLTPSEKQVAPILYQALSSAQLLYNSSSTAPITGEDLISIATKTIIDKQVELLDTDPTGGVQLKLDYVEVFDKNTFEPIRGPLESGREMVICGAVWVGKTRLIDNLLLGWEVD